MIPLTDKVNTGLVVNDSVNEAFFHNQLDFIRLLYGLSLVLLAAACVPLCRGSQRAPWKWLCLFAVLYALRQWCALVAISMGHPRVLEWVQVALSAVSLGTLVEFARLGTLSWTGKGPGRWILIPLACMSAFGWFAGLQGVDTSIRCVLGLTGGLWSAYALWRHGRLQHPESRALPIAAVSLAAFGLLIGVFVRPSPCPPATIINQDTFLAVTHLPVHVVLAAIVLLLALMIRQHHQASSARALVSMPSREFGVSFLAASLICTLALGWCVTEQVGRLAHGEARQALLNRGRLIAAALEHEQVWRLTAGEEDVGSAAWRAVHEQLVHIAACDPSAVRVYTLKLRNGVIFCSNGSIAEGSPGQVRTGEPCTNTPSEFYSVFATGQAITVGPHTDQCGEFVSGIVPIRLSDSEPVEHVLVLDERAEDWRRLIGGQRLAPLSVTLLIALLLTSFFVVRQISQESTARLMISERRLGLVLETTSEGIWDWDIEAGQIYHSPRWCESLGYSPQEVPETADFRESIIHPDDLPRVREALRMHLDGHSALYECESRMRTKAGTLRHTLSRGKVVERDADGKPRRMVGADADITAGKQAEEFRQQAQRDLRAIFDSVHDAILVHDLSGRILDFNDRMLDLFAVSREEAPELSIENDLSSPENPRGRLEAIWQDAVAGLPQQVEWIARRPHDGSSFPVEISLRKVELGDREVMLAGIRDITQRKVAEQSLRESEERLDLALRGADLGLWDWNVQTGEMHLDERWTGMLGYSPDDIEPHVHTWHGLIHPEDAPGVMEGLRAHLEARTAVFETEYRLKTNSGGWVWVLARGRVMIRSRSGKPLRMSGTHLDITSHKQTEAELQQAKAAAEAARQTESELQDHTRQETRS